MDIYVAWNEGLDGSDEAMKILSDHPLIRGVETKNARDSWLMRAAGLDISLHCPDFNTALGDPHLMEKILGQTVYNIVISEALTVGFHSALALDNYHMIKNHPFVLKAGFLPPQDELIQTMSNNLKDLVMILSGKKVVVESMTNSRIQEIEWDLQKENIKARRAEIEDLIDNNPTDHWMRYISDPDYMEELLDSVPGSGFLLDVAHCLVSGDARIHYGRFSGTIEDYFSHLIETNKGRIYQMHLNRPKDGLVGGFIDAHQTFEEDHIALDLAKEVVDRCPELEVLTLEMYTFLEPVEHAKKMCQQAEFIANKLGL